MCTKMCNNSTNNSKISQEKNTAKESVHCIVMFRAASMDLLSRSAGQSCLVTLWCPIVRLAHTGRMY